MKSPHRLLLPLSLCLITSLGFIACTPTDDSPEAFGIEHPVHQKGYKTSPYTVRGVRYRPISVDQALTFSEEGMASWYGRNKKHERTSTGEIMRSSTSYSAAHKTLPLPCVVKVTCPQTGKSVLVRVNDRGPFTKGRIIDLSPLAAHAIGLKSKGVSRVRIEVVSVGDDSYKRTASS